MLSLAGAVCLLACGSDEALVELPAALQLVDFAGDCDGLSVRLRSGDRYIGVVEPDPCGSLLPVAGVDQFVDRITRRMSAGGWRELDPGTGEYGLIRVQGDCSDALYDIQDYFLDRSYSLYLETPCDDDDDAVDQAEIANRLVSRHLAAGYQLVANEPTGLAQLCDHRVDPGSYREVLRAMPRTSSQWRVVCFDPGNYQAAVLLRDYSNLALVGPGADLALWIAIRPLPDDAAVDPIPGDDTLDPSAVLDIRGGKNILVSGFRFENRYRFTRSDDTRDTVSRAVYTQGASGVTIADSEIVSYGKQTLWFVDGQRMHANRLFLSGAYFTFSTHGGSSLVQRSHLQQRLPGDGHSLTWVYAANQYYRDITATRYTGQAFLAGENQSHAVRVERLASDTLDSWVQQHPNYPGLTLHLYPPYPEQAVDYYYNEWRGGGLGAGTKVIRHAPPQELPSPRAPR